MVRNITLLKIFLVLMHMNVYMVLINGHDYLQKSERFYSQWSLFPDDLKSLSWWRKRPNSAHLYLKDWDRSRLHWTDRDRTGSAFSNLEIKDSNKLIIKEQGTYFVYAAILFEFGLIDKVPQVYYNISSYFPPVPNFPPFLVMGKYGGSKFSDRRHTGYLSGIVELYQGHQISVSVNDHRFIDSSPYGNYFGLIKL